LHGTGRRRASKVGKPSSTASRSRTDTVHQASPVGWIESPGRHDVRQGPFGQDCPTRSRTLAGMARRAVPALLVAAAALADARGEPTFALYAILAAVPALAVAALASFGDVLDGEPEASRQLQALLWTLALVLAVSGAAVRAPALRDGALPPLAVTALFACLVVLALEAAVGAARAAVERPARERPRPSAAGELRRAA
jgi:hypothetical protein